MKTFIVLIPLENLRDARKYCESIENYKFDIGGSVQATAYDVQRQVRDLIEDTFNSGDDDLSVIEVETLTDFMDRCNDQELALDNYFISYVNA
jgi:hypothetical protein